MSDRKFYKIRVDGDGIASVQGYLNEDELSQLEQRCKDLGVDFQAEVVEPAVGLEQVLEEVDERTTWSIKDVLEHRSQSDDEETFGQPLE